MHRVTSIGNPNLLNLPPCTAMPSSPAGPERGTTCHQRTCLLHGRLRLLLVVVFLCSHVATAQTRRCAAARESWSALGWSAELSAELSESMHPISIPTGKLPGGIYGGSLSCWRRIQKDPRPLPISCSRQIKLQLNLRRLPAASHASLNTCWCNATSHLRPAQRKWPVVTVQFRNCPAEGSKPRPHSRASLVWCARIPGLLVNQHLHHAVSCNTC